MALWVWALSPPMQQSLSVKWKQTHILFHLCFTGLNPGRGKWSRPPGTTGSQPAHGEQTGGTSWHISLLQSQTAAPFLAANRVISAAPHEAWEGLHCPFVYFGNSSKAISPVPSLCSPSAASGQGTTAGCSCGTLPCLLPSTSCTSLILPWLMCGVGNVFCIFSIILREEMSICIPTAVTQPWLCVWFLLSPVLPCTVTQREHSTSLPSSSSHVTWD